MESVPPDAGLSIAVVGMAGRFSGSLDVDELWSNLCEGVECITTLTPQQLEEGGVPASVVRRPEYVARAGIVPNEEFDGAAFGISSLEAELMDPQIRLLLRCARETLENAGHVPSAFDGKTGVFAGMATSLHALRACGAFPDVDPTLVQTLNDKDFLATRLAYHLDCRGPAITVQTACSSSLVAIALGAQSLLTYESDLVLAGGVSLAPRTGYLYRAGGLLSPDGRCRTFDVRAAGTVPGSGAAMVALRRLDDAIRDGDRIHAVLRAAAVGNDGREKAAYDLPSVAGQARVARAALDLADVDPSTIGFIEAHGMGTELGDAMEVKALLEAYGPSAGGGRCVLGSMKPNVGYLDVASGVAGFIKAVCAVREGRIPGTLHFEHPNPALSLDRTPFRVLGSTIEWPSDGRPRRAGVCARGIGGTNAHAIVEEAPVRREGNARASA